MLATSSSGEEEEAEEEEVTMDKDGRIGFEGSMDFSFCAYTDALKFNDARTDCENALIADCESAFVEGGISFWVGAGETGRCGLEELALSIFKHHTQNASFDIQKSGVEWWVQVRRNGGGRTRSQTAGVSIGMHWDKDEDLVS